MIDEPETEIVAGETYEMTALFAPPGVPPTRVIAESDRGGGMWRVRRANGLDSVTFANHLAGPVEPLRPGVEESCLLCRGEKVVTIDEPVVLVRFRQHLIPAVRLPGKGRRGQGRPPPGHGAEHPALRNRDVAGEVPGRPIR